MTTLYTITSGNFDDPGIWDDYLGLRRVPLPTDEAIIAIGHVIQPPTNMLERQAPTTVYGTLANGGLTFRDTELEVMPGGVVRADTTQLFFYGTTVTLRGKLVCGWPGNIVVDLASQIVLHDGCTVENLLGIQIGGGSTISQASDSFAYLTNSLFSLPEYVREGAGWSPGLSKLGGRLGGLPVLMLDADNMLFESSSPPSVWFFRNGELFTGQAAELHYDGNVGQYRIDAEFLEQSWTADDLVGIVVLCEVPGLTPLIRQAQFRLTESMTLATIKAAVDDAVSKAELARVAALAAARPGDAMVLTAQGLDNIPITSPSGPATTFREMVVQTWRRFFKKATKSASQITTYLDDGTTPATVQNISSSSLSETQGEATSGA
jgi:hypothetical protein